jgi:nucleolar protein 14
MANRERKVAATDRTRTPDEIAQDEADRLHELETRRLARMNGDQVSDDDEVSNIEINKSTHVNDDEMQDLEQIEQRMKGNKDTNEDSGESDEDSEDDSDQDSQQDSDDDDNDSNGENDDSHPTKTATNSINQHAYNTQSTVYTVGTRVRAMYHATDQMDDEPVWYEGTIAAVHNKTTGSKNTSTLASNYTYDIDYDDGDFEDGVLARHVVPLAKDDPKVQEEEKKRQQKELIQQKRKLAREQARYVYMQCNTTQHTQSSIVSI